MHLVCFNVPAGIAAVGGGVTANDVNAVKGSYKFHVSYDCERERLKSLVFRSTFGSRVRVLLSRAVKPCRALQVMILDRLGLFSKFLYSLRPSGIIVTLGALVL